jgi:photosystem II stability/assembly factor-like uncharacterized protein
MSDRALIATRKGLFIAERGKAGWRISLNAFAGIPVSQTLHDTRDNTLYAALNHGHFGAKLHRSDDGGKSWTEIAVPAFPKEEDNKDAPALIQIWSLEKAPGNGALWAGCMPGGLFRSNDRGENWQLVESLWNEPSRAKWFGGGNDAPGMHSVLPGTKDNGRVAIAVSCGGVWMSDDQGKSWQVGGKGLINNYMPPDQQEDPVSQDPHRVQQCLAAPDVMWMQHHCGAFRSTDGGAQWSKLAPPVSDFGFTVAAHPKDPQTAWLAPAISGRERMAVGGRLRVTRTRDGGKSWDVLDRGLPQENVYDLIYRHGLDVDDSGETLIMGSTTGGLWTSDNGGEDWASLGVHLPPIYGVRFFGH